MIIEYLAVLVANGTAIGSLGYHPALPFYNFAIIVPLITILTSFFWGVRGACVIGASIAFATMCSFLVWSMFRLDPSGIFVTWSLALLLVFLKLSRYLDETPTHKPPMPP